ncbi:TRAP transporter large permease [Algihabitans albus]|uniref:TRAP transporter large permease n=1 Tax=Algihabitans albus TaxID=2164067 RepID=UPI0013C2D5EA|nr:TRAP transporter large permease [Algihabitans albus]
MAVFLIVALFVLLVLGVPVAFALGTVGLATILLFDVTSLTQLAQSQFSGLDSFVLLAIPFFILAGNIMVEARMAPQLFDLMRCVTRPIRGGDAVGATLSAALFGAMTGSSVASAAALGRIVIPELDRAGYPRRFSGGLLAAGGTLGIMIPPSIVFVIYGAIAQVSVTDMFKAGILPGTLVTLLLIGVTLVLVHRNGWGERGAFSPTSALRALGRAGPALLMPTIVLGGIYGGIFTPTEAAAISALYGLFIAAFVYRTVGLAALAVIFARSARMTASILFIVAQALFIGLLATLAGIPAGIVEAVGAFDLEPWMFLLIVNLALLVLGCFLDGVTILTVVAPLLLSAVRELGIDPVHFGIILTLNIEIAAITPPIGMNLFVISGISGTRPEEVIRGVVPFVGIMLLALVLVTYLPWISLAFLD